MSCDIWRVLEINEVGSYIALQFELSLEWRDPRLKFVNLKTDSDLNTLNAKEKNKIWVPEIIFLNTEKLDTTLNDDESFIVLKRQGKHRPNQVQIVWYSFKEFKENIVFFIEGPAYPQWIFVWRERKLYYLEKGLWREIHL